MHSLPGAAPAGAALTGHGAPNRPSQAAGMLWHCRASLSFFFEVSLAICDNDTIFRHLESDLNSSSITF